MTTYNARNERMKREYLIFLKEAKRLNEASVDGVVAALHRFEVYTGFRDFRQFHIQQAIGFKRHLAQEKNARTGKPLSKATMHTILSALKTFFHWLAGRPGYKSRLSYADSEYFNLTEKETREAKAHTERPVPTIEQICHVLGLMPAETEIERRNRALIAITLLTGARVGAIASLKLKHIDLVEGRVVHDAREVRTKFSKSFPTYFFPVGDDARRIVQEWVDFLRTERLWSIDDPLFPATEMSQGNNQQFRASGLAHSHWTTSSPIRNIFRKAFELAGLPYFHPHSFRKTLAQLGERICRTPEEFKAWSQNLGHEKVMTTFSSYGAVATSRQAEIFRRLDQPDRTDIPMEALVEQLRQIAACMPSGS